MYRVTKHGSDFRICKDGETVLVIAPSMGTVYTRFSKLYDKRLTPCDNAFDWWLADQRSQELVCMREQCTVRALRPDEQLVDYTTNPYKPPVGLTPHSIWLTSCAEDRVADITQAMQRYTAARLPIPQDWLGEYNELCDKLKGS